MNKGDNMFSILKDVVDLGASIVKVPINLAEGIADSVIGSDEVIGHREYDTRPVKKSSESKPVKTQKTYDAFE
jgi:hypothetical protein